VSFPSRPRAAVAAMVMTLAALACAASPSRAAWPNNGRALCTATGDQSNPAIVGDGGGGAIVVWEDRRGTTPDIYAQRVTAGGALAPGWPANGSALTTAALDQLAPVIAADGHGGAFVAWEDYRAGGANTSIYVQHVTATGTIATGWPANGLGLCIQAGTQGHPTIVADGNGGAIVAWEDFRSGTGDIYVQTVNAIGQPRWSANGVPVATASGDQRFPVAVSDGNGGAIVAWEDSRQGNADPYAQRIDGSGHPVWAANGVALCTQAQDQVALRIVDDGSGGAIVSWEDYRDDNSDIYAQRIDASGATKWAANGVGACRDSSEQYSASIVGDGGGGAFVAWTDLRNGLEDIYAQHVTAAGDIATGWIADGRAVCAAAGSQSDPRVASDGAGGAFIGWIDSRPGTASLDVYAQRMTSTGATPPGWPTDGLALCSSNADQPVEAITSDGLGGAVLTWHDLRSGNADIYALRVTASGAAATVDVPEEELLSASPLQAAPNPLRDQTWLRFRLAQPDRITAMVVDVTGRRIRSLADDASLPAGDQTMFWDGRDATGAPVPVGIYLFLMKSSAGTATAKLAVIR